MKKQITINLCKAAILSGPVLVLRPLLVLEFGGICEALVFEQLSFHCKAPIGSQWEHRSVRFSYSKLQKQIRYFTRRSIIKAVMKLEALGAICVTREGRVNVYQIRRKYKFKVLATPHNMARMVICPEMAGKVSLLDAVALQQIHLRHVGSDCWAIHSFAQWHSGTFMFLGIATVKRLFAKLMKQGLVLVKPYQAETGMVNSYRVNYIRLAEVLGVPLPNVSDQKDESSDYGISLLYPVTPSSGKPNSQESNVHQPISNMHHSSINCSP